MQIWLGKNMLGQSNKHEIQAFDAQTISIIHYGENSPQQWSEKMLSAICKS